MLQFLHTKTRFLAFFLQKNFEAQLEFSLYSEYTLSGDFVKGRFLRVDET